jgi:hypothetical protein
MLDQIEKLVDNKDLKITILSRKGDYQIQVYTERAAKDADATGLRRTYSLTELDSGGVISENWGRKDPDRLSLLLSRLLQYSDYDISSVVSDWIVTCPECGHQERGRHYEPRPISCRSPSSTKCSLKAKKKFKEKAVITEEEVNYERCFLCAGR